MKKWFLPALLALSVLLSLPAPPASAGVDVNVNIGIPFPGFRVEADPEMVLVPEARVYFAPRVGVDLFFFDGFWFTRDRDRWYRGPDYRGPWREVPPRRVPPPVFRMRPDYRDHWGRERHIPYGQLKKHWREHRIHDDYRRDRDDYRHRDWKEEKRERKEEEKRWKEERKHEEKRGKGHGRGREDD
jgi:hypothetical protein